MKNQVKNRVIHFRVNSNDLKKFKKLCDEKGTTVSGEMRKNLLNAIK